MKRGSSWWRGGWCALVLFASAARADLHVVGSDLLGLDFSQALYAFSVRSGIPLTLAFDGSRSGMEKFQHGHADLALVALQPEERARLKDLRVLPLGYHPVVVLAPAACPIEQISVEQLAAIFGTPESGTAANVTRWAELDPDGAWNDAVIGLFAPEAGSGITAEFFRHAVLRNRTWRPNVHRYAAAGELQAALGAESRAIALAPSLPRDAKGIKVLRVTSRAPRPAVSPNPASLHDGTYPLRLPVWAVVAPGRQVAVAGLVEHLYGDDIARILERAGVSALPPAARAEQLRAIGLKEKPPR